MTAYEQVLRATEIVDEMIEFLRSNDETDFLPGLKEISRIGHSVDSKPDEAEDILTLQEQIYRSMQRGMGSFADIVIYDDDFDKRYLLNSQFENLKKNLVDSFATR